MEQRTTGRLRWSRRAAVATALAVAALGLSRLDLYVRTPVGAAGTGEGPYPVVEVAGLGSRGGGFALLTRSLQSAGTTVLDFDADRAGVQPLLYEPRSGQDIADVAVQTVLPAIRAALTRAGLDPDTQRVDVVAHSTGGLLMRYLVERPVDGWDHRVDDLVLVAVPDHGSTVVWLETRGGGPFSAMGDDMRPGSRFLDALGYDEPSGQTYTTIGGDPWLGRLLHPTGLGFDDQVPARSPFLDGAANNTYPHLHGGLLKSAEVVDLVTATVAAH